MATLDEPRDPEEALAAAESAHLANRRTVPVARSTRPAGPDGQRETVRLPRRRSARRAPLAVAAPVALGLAILLSFAPVAAVVMLLQATGGGPVTPGGSMRVAAAGWLLAHGVPVDTAIGPVGLAPLAVTGLVAWRLARAGVHVTRARGGRRAGAPGFAFTVGGAVAVGYGAVGGLVAALVDGAGSVVNPARAALTFAAFGMVTGSWGGLGATGARDALAARSPPMLRDGVRTGLVAAALVFAAGAGVAGVAIALGGGAAADTLAAYRTGASGQVGLTLLCLAYAPNVAAWAVAYLVGPGFAVGTDTVVRSSEVAVGPLPPLPVFDGVPAGPLPTAGAMLFAVPMAAGLVAGWLLARRLHGSRPAGPAAWPRLLRGAVGAGPVAGVVLGLVAAASGGPLGGGHFASIGPVAWQVAAVSAVVVAAGALLGAAGTAGFAAAAVRRRV